MDATTVTVVIPADSRFIALARLTASGLASELDFDVDTIDDLRIAVNEIVAVVVEWAADHQQDEVTVSYSIEPDSLTVRASVGDRADTDSVELDPLTERILASVTDHHEVGATWASVRKARPGS